MPEARTPSSSDNSVTRRPERIRLAGPSSRPDPRVNAYRRDVADVALAGRLFAPHYAAASHCHLTSADSMIRAEPSAGSRAVSQLVLGEEFLVFDIIADWAWGRSAHDDYVGYLPVDRLGPVTVASHRIAAPLALVFAEPDIKAPVAARWPIGARFAATAVDDRFLKTEAGFVHSRHAALPGAMADPVAIAESLLGQPYLWGGRGSGGIDCSGLVQVALSFADTCAPRDSDMQQDGLGTPIPADAPLQRGDLVFFPGHVGLMTDGERLIHANAHWMAVTIEPLADVVARLAPHHAEPILARKRLA